MTSKPGLAPARDAARAEERVFDLRRVRNAEDDRLGVGGERCRIGRLRDAVVAQALERFATSVHAGGHFETAATQRRRHRLTHRTQSDEADARNHERPIWAWPQDNLREAAKAP